MFGILVHDTSLSVDPLEELLHVCSHLEGFGLGRPHADGTNIPHLAYHDVYAVPRRRFLSRSGQRAIDQSTYSHGSNDACVGRHASPARRLSTVNCGHFTQLALSRFCVRASATYLSTR